MTEPKHDDVRDAMLIIESALRDIPSPRPSFDPERIDYIVPRTLEGSVRSAVTAILIMGARSAAPEIERQARADERRLIQERLAQVIGSAS